MCYRIIKQRESCRDWHRFPEADLWEHLRALDMIFFE